MSAGPFAAVIALTRRIHWFEMGEETNISQHHHAWWCSTMSTQRANPRSWCSLTSMIQHLFDRPRTRLGERRARQPHLSDRLQRCVTIGGGEGLGQEGLEARIVVEAVGEAVALDADARLPAGPALFRRMAPRVQV